MLVKEVDAALASDKAECTTEKLDEDGFFGPYREQTGDPALKDSIDVAGDTPSDVYERRFADCKEIKAQLDRLFERLEYNFSYISTRAS